MIGFGCKGQCGSQELYKSDLRHKLLGFVLGTGVQGITVYFTIRALLQLAASNPNMTSAIVPHMSRPREPEPKRMKYVKTVELGDG
jgi:hypothetical protein